MSESTFESQVARFEKPAFLKIHDLKGCRENYLILKKNNFPLLQQFTLTDNTFKYNFSKVKLGLKIKHWTFHERNQTKGVRFMKSWTSGSVWLLMFQILVIREQIVGAH